MDKWLWAARFYKTRALAARACELGRVEANGQIAKAAKEVRLHDKLRVTNDGGIFEIEVLQLSDARGPASQAQTLFEESDASKEARSKLKEERKAMNAVEKLPNTRPDKRDRRLLSRFRGRG